MDAEWTLYQQLKANLLIIHNDQQYKRRIARFLGSVKIFFYGVDWALEHCVSFAREMLKGKDMQHLGLLFVVLRTKTRQNQNNSGDFQSARTLKGRYSRHFPFAQIAHAQDSPLNDLHHRLNIHDSATLLNRLVRDAETLTAIKTEVAMMRDSTEISQLKSF